MSEAERKLCHRVLYDFFHGKIENPVEAGMSTWPACWVLYVAHEYVHVLYGFAQLYMQLSEWSVTGMPWQYYNYCCMFIHVHVRTVDGRYMYTVHVHVLVCACTVHVPPNVDNRHTCIHVHVINIVETGCQTDRWTDRLTDTQM